MKLWDACRSGLLSRVVKLMTQPSRPWTSHDNASLDASTLFTIHPGALSSGLDGLSLGREHIVKFLSWKPGVAAQNNVIANNGKAMA